MFFTSFLLCCFFSFTAGAGAKWSYNDTTKWNNDYPNCAGKKQSPINIVRSATTCNESLAELLTYTSYDKAGSGNFIISNNGHTCTVNTEAAKASIALDGVAFKLVQFHFHWGSTSDKGSEHQIDGKSYPAELHLVHYNGKYASFDAAKVESDGLAVLGVFIKEGAENSAFKKFLDLNVSADGSSVNFTAFPVKDVLPENRKSFYRYSGSLTAPTCDQSVSWTVFSNNIQMSKEQLGKFRKLKTSGGEALVDNFRPTQNLNGRKVLASFDDGYSGCSAAGIFKPSIVLLLITGLLRFAF